LVESLEGTVEKGEPLKRRRLVLVAMIAVLALVAAACGEDTPTAEPTSPTPAESETSEAPTETGTPIPEFTTLEEGVLTVASCLDYSPFEFVEGGDEKGFDVDMAEEIATRLGLTVEWIRAPFDTVFTALAAGQFDMVAAAVTSTGELGAERDEIVDFTIPYFNTNQALIVNQEQTPDIQSVDDLQEGDLVGVQRGTTAENYAQNELESRGIVLRTYQTVPQEFTDLEAGNIVAVVNDEQQSLIDVPRRPSLAIVDVIDTQERYSFALQQENPELTEAVNIVLAEIIADGTYAQFFEQWFPDFELPPEYEPTA
jgi:ABC-type amino acid transport substrate-binding protein